MDSPQRQQRREFRYPLHLPVLVRMRQRNEIHARSENISLGGILLFSASQIAEGSEVEVSIGVKHLPDPGILLNAHGKVLRVQPMVTGDFAVAIRLDQAFALPPSLPLSGSERTKTTFCSVERNSAIGNRNASFALAWDTET